MKNLILLFCTVLLFNACKKTENITSQNSITKYSGIKNVEEFDKVIKTITKENINGRNGDPNTINSIKLSKAAIEEMRNSIQFDKLHRFKGFIRNGLMIKELNNKQIEFLFTHLIGSQILLFDGNSKIINNSNLPSSDWKLPNAPGTHIDWRWQNAECCSRWYDATCVTYGTGIQC